MPFFENQGLRLHFEVTGEGTPIVFAHEFAGDATSWEPQVRYFARRYTCVTYNARGYPPSDVPEDGGAYSQANAVADLAALLDHLDIAAANLVGLSMGSFTALHFGMTADKDFYDPHIFNLRSQPNPPYERFERLRDQFQTTLASVVFLSRGATQDEALARADEMRQALRRKGIAAGQFADLDSILYFVPTPRE